MKMYIAVLDTFPDYMTPTLVAHSVLLAHMKFENEPAYKKWLKDHFKKCVLRVNSKEFEKIRERCNVAIGYEKTTLGGKDSCLVVCPYEHNEDIPKVLKFAKLWKPKEMLDGC